MSEPEEVLLEAAHAAAVHGAALWRRVRPRAVGGQGLAELRPRLELFVSALCPGAPPFAVAEPPARPTWLGRIARRLPRRLVEREPVPSTDGRRLRLPARLEVEGLDDDDVPAIYRVLALGLALRARRGSPRWHPIEAGAPVRDLYVLAEAAAAEHELAELAPGLAPVLADMRGRALARRPAHAQLAAGEHSVERLLRAVLSASPGTASVEPPISPTPAASLAWALAAARTLVPPDARYRGIAAVWHWGRIDPWPDSARAGVAALDARSHPPRPVRTRMLARRPRVRKALEGEDDEHVGPWIAPTSDRDEAAEDPKGLTRPTDRDAAADVEDLADAVAELPEARLVTTPGSPAEILASADPPETRGATASGGRLAGAAVSYPEWDWRAGAYVQDRVRVRLVMGREGPGGPGGWSEAFLARHAALVHQTRRRFERLRPRRIRRTRQADGPDFDLDAWIESHADVAAGQAASDRVYVSDAPLRRDLALVVLVDASMSTDAWVEGNRRIIDVEKEALLLVCEAIRALGDRSAILAFSGEGPEAVEVATLKDFRGTYDGAVRRRIGGLEPERYTRLGAALRHATAVLARERARHRLLLLLSDGKPNDVDQYEGRYGVEDARQAVHEAHVEGVRTFCLTVDRQAVSYVPRIFGPAGFTVIRRTAALPAALLEAVRQFVN